MKYYGKAKITKIEERNVEYLRCDNCHKKIKLCDKYYRIRTGHGDWGNDSVDSVRRYDICEDCVNNYIIDYMNSERMQRSYTAYIEVDSDLCTENNYGKYDDFEDELVEKDEYNEEKE